MIGLTMSYCHLGRDQDALVMAEKTFQLVRRALPENHPVIGATGPLYTCRIFAVD